MANFRLSFDDGPKPHAALRSIRDTLEKPENNIRADFYVNGIEIEGNPTGAAILKELHAAGHKVENHAFTHNKLGPMPADKVLSEVARTQQLIKDATGRLPNRLRPPYGNGAKDAEVIAAARAHNLTITLWQVDTEDWKSPMAGKWAEIMKGVEWAAKTFEKPDILMHVKENTARDLPELISRLKAAGHGFI